MSSNKSRWLVLNMHVLCALLSLLPIATALASQRFIDDARRTVIVPDKVTRVFAAGAPAEVLLYTLAPEMLVGRNHLPSAAALEFTPERLRTPLQINRLPNAENANNDAELLALHPDVYIDYGDINDDYVDSLNNVQLRTEVPALILDGSLDKIPGTYRRLGKLLGLTERGEILARQSQDILTRYRAMVRNLKVKPRVYLTCSDLTMPCLDRERSSEQARWLGVVNVASEAGVEPARRVASSDLVAWRPDVIVTGSQDAANRMLNDTDWQQVGAVVARRVHAPPTLPFNWGPRPPSINRLPGLMWLAYVVSGKPFDADLNRDLKIFFRSFYHVELSDAQLNALLGQPSMGPTARP